MGKISTCLWFDGKAKEAAELYTSVVKQGRIISESPMVVMMELNGRRVMGLNGGPMFTINPSISFTLTCSSVVETRAAWDKLVDGGSVLMDINTYPWSECYGWLKDKFGMTWQITVAVGDIKEETLTPSFLFTGKVFGRAGEAITFYSDIFAGSGTNVLVQYPPGDPHAGNTMFASFHLMGHPLIAMDGPGEHAYQFNEAVSLVVNCNTQEEIDYYWNKLTEEGAESQCGWLKDKFGVSWQIVPVVLGQLMSDPERAPRVVQAFMQMKKMDIATLMNA
ncbi:MAG: VOC family protein [Bacteroidetes bacterium]|nr:VOC family protein [Bacteroidota bacterium]